MTLIDKACFERGCACYDSRDKGECVEVVEKREWAGLTDDEIKEIVGPYGDTSIKGYTRKLFDQIEAALRSKNT